MNKIQIALLRGINVGGHHKIPMAELRNLCDKVGLGNTESYIQSGNLVFSSSLTCREAEDLLEETINQHFGFSIPVIVRTAEHWHSIMTGNPFPSAAEKEPNLVMLGVTKDIPADDAREGLLKYANNGERVALVDQHLWIYFPGGSGRSKISPAVLDRITHSIVTMRNWRTVQKLGMLTEKRHAS